MSEQNESSLYKEQRKTKPKIEDVIAETLDGDARREALDFAAYLRENKMSPVWTSANSWKCGYKGQGVCYIRLYGTQWGHTSGPDAWSVTLYGDNSEEYNEFVVNGNYRDIVWNSRASKKCFRCQPQRCAPKGQQDTFMGHKMVFFGKEFENACCNGDHGFSNPDERTLGYIKGAIDVRRQRIKNGTCPKSSMECPVVIKG